MSNKLQYQLKSIACKYDMKVPTSETKVMGMFGRDIQRIRIEIDRSVIE
jgi:hypothetical protein